MADLARDHEFAPLKFQGCRQNRPWHRCCIAPQHPLAVLPDPGITPASPVRQRRGVLSPRGTHDAHGTHVDTARTLPLTGGKDSLMLWGMGQRRAETSRDCGQDRQRFSRASTTATGLIFLSGAILGLVIALFLAWALWSQHCADRCGAAIEQADRLAADGNLRGALLSIDAADAACRCSRFTEGDEPPEYAAAETYLDMLRTREGQVAIAELSRSVKGPIMRELVGARP
jgi:hypothetical protein